MIKVNIEIESKSWYKKIKSPKKYFKNKLKKINENLKFLKDRNLIFTILLTNSYKMKKLNRKFRNLNQSTDVLSFPYYSSNKIKLFKNKENYVGDIATSYEIINSRTKKNNFNFEFDKVWIHGFLHLLGYDHKKNKDYFKMNKLEKKILNLIYF
tara:strand:- start:159 stop:620 length:462 start_codon:yes stop_codon:yes gene_type:complete